MDETHPHFDGMLEALAQEWSWQRRAHGEALALPWADRVQAGVSWPLLRVESVEPSWRRTELVLRARGPLHDGIRGGDPVVISPPARPDDGVDAMVLDVDGRVAVVGLRRWIDPEEGGWLAAGEVAITRALDPRTFQRYRAALRRAAAHDSPLCAGLLGAPESGRGEAPAAASLPGLDAAQARAAGAALSEAPLVLVHGPPGTGKTWLLGRVLRALADADGAAWALAESNAAVDHLALAAAGRGLDVVRLGHEARVGPRARHLGVQARLRESPYAQAIQVLDKELGKLQPRDRAAAAERRQLQGERRALQARAWTHLVEGAQVIAATFGTLAHKAEALPRVRTAVVDEATQALEPAVWVAVPWVDRLVLVGDPAQLGPVVKQPGNPLAEGLLQRLLREGDHPLPMLEVQHRMSAAVQGLVGPTYGPAYRPHPAVAEQRLTDLPGVRPTSLTDRALLWIDTAGAGFQEDRDPVSRSLFNAGEVEVVGIVLGRLLAAGVTASEVGVITPYSAQVGRLKAHPALQGVEVATVNSFQGREKEVMVCSWVRGNDQGEVGFVADDRRLTVAWSRARRLLIQVGDTSTLGGRPRFARAFEELDAAGSMVSVWEPPWVDAVDA